MTKPKSGAERVRQRRDKVRDDGLRPVGLWVVDTRVPGFPEECDRQARLIREAETSKDGIEAEAWFETSDRFGWT